YKVIGILSNKNNQIGSNIHGIRVYDKDVNADKVIEKLKIIGKNPQKIVLSHNNPQERLRKFVNIADKHGLTVGILPELSNLHDGKNNNHHSNNNILNIRPIKIEDLLGRTQSNLNISSMQEMIHDKVVMITGAGGTIGSEIVKQLVKFKPKKLILLEISEFNLYNITQELNEINASIINNKNNYGDNSSDKYQVDFSSIITDVKDRNKIFSLMQLHKPQIVFHAAAIKHVPIAEENIIETISTNVLGSINIADSAIDNNVESMILISTDKAVNPSSIMGVSKRLAEIYCHSLGMHNEINQSTKFATIRFGNVLGSSGSVVPLFEKQLKQGGPLTITDENVERYFMTVNEAVSLVIQSATLSHNQITKSNIYVLDMGKPIKIKDLAIQMIKMAGLKPDIDIKISSIGLRPGEKLQEELFYHSEKLINTQCKSIMLATPTSIEYNFVMDQFKAIVSHSKQNKLDNLLNVIYQLIPEYKNNCDIAANSALKYDSTDENKIIDLKHKRKILSNK
ncbi:MAG: polysaccharide biosynthesis protein, partial [Pseudomonadota bacterium]